MSFIKTLFSVCKYVCVRVLNTFFHPDAFVLKFFRNLIALIFMLCCRRFDSREVCRMPTASKTNQLSELCIEMENARIIVRVADGLILLTYRIL